MNRPNTPRPLSFSLARLTSSVAVASALSMAAQAAVVWDGSAPAGLVGDGLLWTDARNWSLDTLPGDFDDVIFGNPLTTPGTILLNGDKTVNSIQFTETGYTLGAYGTNNVLNNGSGLVSVDAGKFATLNAAYGANFGLILSGGGALYLNNAQPVFAGDISVDGAGTTLIHRQEGPTVQYNGINSAQEFGRFDQMSLGYQRTVKNIILTNGGEYRIINAGNNSEGGYKNIIIGSGGGTLNLAAGYIVQNLDDLGQIGVTTEAFTKAGKGRLTIAGTMANGSGTAPNFTGGNPLAGIVNINGGILELNTAASTLVGANTYTRYSGIAPTGSTVNINSGGTLLLNNGANVFDAPTINLNNGGIFAVQGGDAQIGYSVAGGASSVTNLTISGTANLLARDLFNTQQERLPRMRSELAGSGTLVIHPNTNNGGNPRLVIERNTDQTSFTGTFRLLENMAIEANPRNMPTVSTGKVIGRGSIDFAGWASRLDVRDSTAALTIFDYTDNNLLLTSTQVGSVPRIVVGRSDAATGTGNMFNFGTLTMSNQRLGVEGNNGYLVGIGGTATISGNAIIESRSAQLVFNNAAAVSEDSAGRTLTLVKNGVGNAAAVDVTSQGAISISNLVIGGGTLALRGSLGAITTGFGGAAPVITLNGGTNGGTTGPTFGTLNLDSNGTLISVSAAENNDRVVDSAILNMRGNSVLRLTGLTGSGTTETIGTVNVSGHGLFDVVKNGTTGTPVALTLNNFALTGTFPTANFTGTTLGVAGTNTSRIIVSGATTGTMGAQYHAGNEWAKYDTTAVDGFALGVTPFVAGDYTIGTAEATWAAGQQIKQNGATLPTLTGNRSASRFAFQTSAANQGLNLAGFTLTTTEGGIISSTNTIGIIDGATGAVPSGTAGITAGTTAPAQLYVHANAQIDIRTPIRNNLGLNGVIGGGDDNAVDFVKSGTSTVRLIHQNLGIATASAATAPFTAITPWQSTLTGSWIINDGTLETHRGEFLNGRPIVLNSGTFFINQPVSIANSGTLLPNYGNNVIVNGNSSFVLDDNGESNDVNVGGAALVPLGTLTINNGSTLSFSGYGNGQAPVVALNLTGGEDAYFAGGTNINGGKATFNLALARTGTTSSLILGGAITGDGFDVVAYGTAPSTLVIGGGLGDTAANTYTAAPIVLGGIVRLNKANGVDAIPNLPASEDLIINGGTVAWGPGDHGDLVTNNNINIANNALTFGIAPTSPAAVKSAGMNQIADGATVTLLSGTFGDADRINNEVFGTLIQKNGAFNVGLGSIQVTSATISGGAFGIDRGGAFKAGTLTLQVGSPDLNITTGLPAGGTQTTLEIGAGGLSLTGQNINLGTGTGGNAANNASGNLAGGGGVLKLGGNVTVVGSDFLGGSYSRKGIYVQTGASFRELGNSRIDLLGGVRDFNIDTDALFTVTAPIVNGGLTKSGNGALILEPYIASSFAGPITVNSGVLQAKGDGALGASAGGVTIANGGTVKLDSGWTYGKSFTVSGPGALIPGGIQAREVGALIAESGYNRLTGAVAISGNATLAGNTFLDPSVTPGAGGAAFRIGTLSIEGAGGVTGTGTLTLSGNGDGVIANGINTTGAVVKDGAGRWTIGNAGSYAGLTTITAGTLRISNGAALGSAAGGTRVYGGALELLGGISLAEPFTLSGDGTGVRSGAIVSLSGVNTLTGAITVLGTTIRSEAGTLNLNGAITGGSVALRLDGAGNGAVNNAIVLSAPPTGDVLTKAGTGTWTLNNANALSGSTAVNGGTLVLAGAGAKLSSLSPVNLGGGSLVNTGVAQTVNGLNLNSGGGLVAGGSGLSVGIITRSPGSNVRFSGSVTAGGTANTNGIIGGYATVGNNWARIGAGSSVVALPGASYVNLPAATATDNAIQSNFSIAGAPLAVNSLKISAGSGLDVGFNGLTLSSGGLMFDSSVNGGIAGGGLITGASFDDELFVHVTGAGALDITSPLIGGNGGLVKAGNGKLVLSGSSNFFGPIAVNAGTLSIVGPGGTAASPALGSSSTRTMTLNGGTFEVVGNDYDPGAGTMQIAIGGAGGTIRATLGSQITLNDPGQFSGSGDITYTGGGRYRMQAGTPRFTAFTGSVTIDGGLFSVGDSETIGGRQNQTITLKAGSAILNGTGFGLGQNGLPNNMVVEGGAELYSLGGNRVFAGDIQFSGTNTIALVERDTLNQERQMFLNGRVSGTGITLNVFGAVNTQPLYLASGANTFTGAINMNANATLEVRTPGSLGVNTGDVAVNLNGVNSRLLLRHFQNGDYKANVNVAATAEINSAQLVGFAGGTNQYLTINNLTVNTPSDSILTFNGGNSYTTRVAGTATVSSNTAFNVLGGAGVLFENGINFTGGADTLDKRGGSSVILNAPANNSGPTIVQGGFLILQGANGSLPGTSSIQLRGGELRVDNSSAVNGNRLNDAAPIVLGGGVLRITGAETIGTVSAVAGTTQVIYNPTSETVASALTLTGFTRQIGSVVQFQSPDTGTTTVGATTVGQPRVSSRIIIPGQANVTGTADTIPGFLGNNNIDFIQYDGTTLDSGQPLGVRDARNPGNNPATFAVPYVNDTAETAWTDNIVLRSGTAATLTLTGNRALDAWKIEAAMTVNLGGNTLRIENGGILAAGNASTINGTAGVGLTAGKGTATAGIAELFIGGNNTLNINATIGNNAASGQSVAFVKTGTGTVNMGNLSANTYSGGTYLHSGTLNTTTNSAFGLFNNPLYLDGGTLSLNVANANSGIGLAGFGHAVNVRGNALIVADNGALAGINNSYAFGALNFSGPYTLGVRGFDSMDVQFIAPTHTFAGTPTIDLPQAASGSNPNTAGAESFVTIGGEITGSGFYISSSGSTDNTAARLQIGNGESAPNTYNGKVTVQFGNFNEDLFVELNKAAGVNAITGDLVLEGGTVLLRARDQIADTSNVTITRGTLNFNGLNETIASVSMKGGALITNPTTGTPAANVINITGDVEVTGLDDYSGIATGFTVGNNSTVTIGGQLRIGTYGRVHLSEGATAGVLNINGGLQMTGALLSQNNGAGPNITRLSSDVTILPAIVPSNIGNSTDSDTFTELNGVRTFTVADGPAGLDLQISSVIRNSTSPVAAGTFVKNGPGVVQLQGGGTGNSYTGGTTVNEGALVLFKSVGVNAIPAGTLTIGDGVGGARADQVIIRNNNQIADTADLVLASSGLLDLDTFNTSEAIRNLSGAAGSAVTLGPTSTFTVNSTAPTTYSGSIEGGGIFTKAGASTLTLDGSLNVWTINDNAGTLNLNANGNYAVVNVSNAGTVLKVGVNQTLTALNIGDGATVILDAVPPSPAPAFAGGFEAGGFDADAIAADPGIAADLGGQTAGVAAVPEPGSIALLGLGALGLLARRRRKA